MPRFAAMNPQSSYLILVADDDADVRGSICAVLESAGYRTLTAEDGRAAIAQLESSPDLVLTDVNMAGSSGLEVINAIRFGGVDVPVIAMSAWQPVGLDPLGIALKLGAARVLHKDRMDDLLSVVGEVLGTKP
jgi:CheY-like chemotaxis protein